MIKHIDFFNWDNTIGLNIKHLNIIIMFNIIFFILTVFENFFFLEPRFILFFP